MLLSVRIPVNQFQHASADVEKMILGNKCDMNDRRQVSKERGEKVGHDLSVDYLHVGGNTLPDLN